MANSKLSMKLLIDSRGKRVLFAEAGKECVASSSTYCLFRLPPSFAFSGRKEWGARCPNSTKVWKNLNNTYIEAGKNKEAYLKPAAPVSSSFAPLLALEGASTPAKGSYKCSECSCAYVYDKPGWCNNCGRQRIIAQEAAEGGGLVKGVVTYMVMDDLEVKPISTISSIALLNSFNVKDVGALEEKMVTLGMKEALKLLKLSLESDKVLTELFC